MSKFDLEKRALEMGLYVYISGRRDVDKTALQLAREALAAQAEEIAERCIQCSRAVDTGIYWDGYRMCGSRLASYALSLISKPEPEKKKACVESPIFMIAAERTRQIEKEGWTPEHDRAHDKGELAIAAAHLAAHGTDATVKDPHGIRTWGCIQKAGKEPTIDNLAKAGALIVAEMERLIRAEAPPPKTREQELGAFVLEVASIRCKDKDPDGIPCGWCAPCSARRLLEKKP